MLWLVFWTEDQNIIAGVGKDKQFFTNIKFGGCYVSCSTTISAKIDVLLIKNIPNSIKNLFKMAPIVLFVSEEVRFGKSNILESTLPSKCKLTNLSGSPNN